MRGKAVTGEERRDPIQIPPKSAFAPKTGRPGLSIYDDAILHREHPGRALKPVRYTMTTSFWVDDVDP